MLLLQIALALALPFVLRIIFRDIYRMYVPKSIPGKISALNFVVQMEVLACNVASGGEMFRMNNIMFTFLAFLLAVSFLYAISAKCDEEF